MPSFFSLTNAISVRPLSVWWNSFVFFVLERSSTSTAGIVIRSIQGGMHAANATMMSMLLFRILRKRAAILISLPYLIWPMGGDATYWVAAGIYPLAGSVSLVGAFLCLRTGTWRWLGMIVIACSTLIVQSGCFMGLLILCACALLTLPSADNRKRMLLALLFALFGYALGFLYEMTITVLPSSARMTQATLFSFGSAWDFLRYSLNLLFIEPSYYPSWLRIIQVAIPLYAGIVVLAETIFMHAKEIRYWFYSVITLIGGFALLILPFIPFYILGSSWLGGRVLLPATVIYLAALSRILQSNWIPKVNALFVYAMIVVLLIGYLPISLTYARAHVTNYQNDISRLATIEKTALDDNVHYLVAIEAVNNGREDNPYNFPFRKIDDSFMTAFRAGSFFKLFVQALSPLAILHDGTSRVACEKYCSRSAATSRMTLLQTSFHFVCYCIGNFPSQQSK